MSVSECLRPVLFGLLLLLTGVCAASAQDQVSAADQTAQANRQFVLAMQALQRADQTYDAQEQAKALLEADQLLKDIVTRLPESPLAVQLVTNQFIGDFDYAEFKGRLRGLACADGQSDICLLHRIEQLMSPIEYPVAAPRWDWLSLAVAHYHIGNRDRVKPIVGPFIQAVRTGSVKDAQSQDLFVGRALALTGEVDLALQLTRQFSDCATRIYNLTDIAEVLAWNGNTARAAEIAEEAADFSRTATCSWELGLVAQALLKAGNESRARTLFLNTVEEQFSRFKDRRGTCCPPELAVAAGDLGDPNLALGLLRTVQDESPWTVPQVLGKLAARGDKTLTLTYADQVHPDDLKAETYFELVAGALKAGDRAMAETVSTRLDTMLSKKRDAIALLQRARADKLLYKDQRWRGTYLAALGEAEKASSAAGAERKDLAVPFLAALVEIETGKPMLE
ncbi:hypothetical protein [Oleisolibacter albus]|uniref:hypothetical protein n=1 Tax=Oleisolibacter albus TaxID=2171757 RepID=UPI001EFD2BE9|nr:hypothetical protein [Oleisolibacter albus]